MGSPCSCRSWPARSPLPCCQRRSAGRVASRDRPPCAPDQSHRRVDLKAEAGALMPLASITSFIEQHTQWALLLMFVLLAAESFGLPLPGETALIACAVLASQGALSIV